MKATAVLALGSPHGDDSVAWHAADRLKGDAGLPCVVEKIVSPWELIEYLRSDRKVIILDACSSGAPLGTVVQLREQELANVHTHDRSTHGGSIGESLRLARALGGGSDDLVVLAVEIDERNGPEMSRAGQEAVHRLEAATRHILSRWRLVE
ncbi:MAG TPA: hydrogenase maturation protease [Planctomycetaceae bacterium]|nr:hydrogenase maturation protease [Planctomycetaceae bacterium]